jgi:hypothetical protein
MPNPATDHFTCIVKSNNAVENVALEIFDLNGKKVEIMQRIKPGTTIVIGKQLLPGMYVASFRQGNKNKVVKLVKY